MDMDGNGRVLYEFGSFTLDTGQGVLLRKGQPVHLAPKSLDILAYLLERSNEVVSKEELMEAVWPDSFVEEANLVVHISALRKLIANDPETTTTIETFPKRGYKLKVDLTVAPELAVTKAFRSTNGSVADESEKIARGFTGFRPRLGIVAIFLLAGVAISSIVAFAVYKLRDPFSGFKNMSAERITNEGQVMSADISPDGNFVVYMHWGKDGFSLWLRSTDAKGGIQIHPPLAGFYGASITPDGQSLVFGAKYKEQPPGAYIMPILGGSPTKLRSDIVPLRLDVSPDGKHFAYIRRDISQGLTYVAVSTIDGPDDRILATRQSPNEYLLQGLSWSADGRKIAVVAQNANESVNRVVEIDVESGAESVITHQNWSAIISAEWLPDMTGLLITAAPETSSARQLWHISYPDGTATQLTNSTANYSLFQLSADAGRIAVIEGRWTSTLWTAKLVEEKDGPVIDIANSVRISSNNADGFDPLDQYSPIAWRHDGRIVFISEESGNTGLWTSNSDGSGRKQLTTEKFSSSAPSFSGDGRSVAFMSNRTGKTSIWMIDMDGGDQRRVTEHSIEKNPALSPDGIWVYYTSGHAGQRNVWRMPVNGGEAEMVVSETSYRPSISPDGRWLLYERPVGNTGVGMGMLDLATEAIRHFDTAGYGPQWLPNSNSFTFLQYTDGHLNLWLHPLDSEKPVPLTKFDSEQITSYGWSRDGKTLAFSRHSWARDLTILTVPK